MAWRSGKTPPPLYYDDCCVAAAVGDRCGTHAFYTRVTRRKNGGARTAYSLFSRRRARCYRWLRWRDGFLGQRRLRWIVNACVVYTSIIYTYTRTGDDFFFLGNARSDLDPELRASETSPSWRSPVKRLPDRIPLFVNFFFIVITVSSKSINFFRFTRVWSMYSIPRCIMQKKKKNSSYDFLQQTVYSLRGD